MEAIVPASISELKLFIKANHIEGLRQFFAINEPLVSIYHDDYQGLELEAFDLDDPILKLLIVKKTQQPKLIELALSNQDEAIKYAALENPSIINVWSEHLLVPESLASLGILRFIESLNNEEKQIFLFKNPALRETRVLQKLNELYFDEGTTLDTRKWLAATLTSRLPEYEFEDDFSGSYEPPIEDWNRQKLIAEILSSILVAPRDLLIDIIAPLSNQKYPKFDLTNTSDRLNEFLATQELKTLKSGNLRSSCEELLATLNTEMTHPPGIEFVGKIGQYLDQEILESNSGVDKLYVASAIRSAAGCLIGWNNRFDDSQLIRLLLCDSKSLRLFALRHIDFSSMISPNQLGIIKKLWKSALKADGNDAMEALTENVFAFGLTQFIYSDAWYDQHEEMTNQFGEEGLEKIQDFFTKFFDYKHLDKYESSSFSSMLSYARDASSRQWQARINKKNPTSTDWDGRSLQKLSISELVDRLRILADKDNFSLKEFALIQAELSDRTLLDEKPSDLAPVRLPPDVLGVLDQLKTASTWHTWLLLGLVGFWIYILLR